METALLLGQGIVVTKPTHPHGETSMLSEMQAVVLQAIINLPQSDRDLLLAQLADRREVTEAGSVTPIYAAS